MSPAGPTSRRRSIVPPRLQQPLTQARPPVDDLRDDALLQRLHFDAVDLSRRVSRLIDIEGCLLTGCQLAGSDLEKLTLTDTRLDRCDLANLRVDHGSLARVEVVAARMTGFTAVATSLRHVVFRDCLAGLSSFRFDSTVAVAFVDCRMHGADFASAELRDTRFVRCDLSGAEFSQAKLKGAVFVDCTWEGVRGVTSLRGATVANRSPIDQLEFTTAMAAGLGITIGDPDDFEDEE
ncbi:MAG: pentapeptide repeat-containing protein [Nocardioidaceae bacterium]